MKKIRIERPEIIFAPGTEEWDFQDMEKFGSGNASIVLPDGREYDFNFVDVSHMGKLLKELNKKSQMSFVPSSLNLIVLMKVNKQSIEGALNEYYDAGFFDQFGR